MSTEIIGHENTKKQLQIAIDAATKRNMAIPHILASGAAGCGKTSMARYVAETIGAPFLSVVPNDLKDCNSVTRVLESLDHSGYDTMGNRIGVITPTILFLDEVHNLPLKGQEILGLAMERFMLETGRSNMYNWTPFFTVIGATTLAGKLSKPFRDRFKLVFNFQPYKLNEMVDIVKYHSAALEVRVTPKARFEIAKRSKGTPRIAVGYVERIRDKMIATGVDIATESLTEEVFKEMGVDSEGYTAVEIRILKVLFEAAAPVGLDNLSIILQEDNKSVKDFAEPHLIRSGLIAVSGKGRIITEKGIRHLKGSGKTKKFIKSEIEFNYKRK